MGGGGGGGGGRRLQRASSVRHTAQVTSCRAEPATAERRQGGAAALTPVSAQDAYLRARRPHMGPDPRVGDRPGRELHPSGARGRRSLSAGPSGCETAAAPSSPAHGDSHTQELHPITELPHL
ncbi:unnamed protein product [Gadus morhua 'NCC']